MNDSHIRSLITPTLTLKASFVNEFNEIDEDTEDLHIMKLNIAPKVNKNVHHNKNERKFAHLNNCDDINADNRANFDYWPIPDQITVTPQHENIYMRESIQTVFIKKKPLEFLDGDYFKAINDKAIYSLFDTIDRLFNLSNLQKVYDTYQVTSYRFLNHLATLNLWSEKWISNPNFNDCKPLYFECSLSGETKYKPFAVMKLTRRQPKISLENVLNPIDPRKSAELLKIPYRADIIILPLNFVEFLALLRVREKIEKQSNKDYYLESWKILLENYVAGIPNYYKFYMQAALNFMNYSEVELFKKNKREVTLSKKLYSQIKKTKEDQRNQCIDRERVYLINQKSHRNLVFGDFPDCCKNLRCFLPKTNSKTVAKLQQARSKSNLTLLDPFSFDRKNLILTVGAIVKEFQCKLSLEPKPDVNKLNISQDILEHEKDFKKKLIAEDDHQKPIF